MKDAEAQLFNLIAKKELIFNHKDIISNLFKPKYDPNIRKDMMFFRINMGLDTVIRQKTLEKLSNNEDVTEEIDIMFEDVQSLCDEVTDEQYKYLATLLQTGKIERYFDGEIKTYDYSLKQELATYDNIKIPSKSKYAIMSKTTYRALLLKNIKKLNKNITILISDYFDDNVVTFIPTLDIGYLHYDITPEESDFGNNDGNKYIKNDLTNIGVLFHEKLHYFLSAVTFSNLWLPSFETEDITIVKLVEVL